MRPGIQVTLPVPVCTFTFTHPVMAGHPAPSASVQSFLCRIRRRVEKDEMYECGDTGKCHVARNLIPKSSYLTLSARGVSMSVEDLAKDTTARVPGWSLIRTLAPADTTTDELAVIVDVRRVGDPAGDLERCLRWTGMLKLAIPLDSNGFQLSRRVCILSSMSGGMYPRL